MAKHHTVDDFWFFHYNNQHVYNAFKYMCHQLRAGGAKKLGIKRICDWVREHYGYKFRNAFNVLWARLLVHEDPSFADYFDFAKDDIDLNQSHRHIGTIQFA